MFRVVHYIYDLVQVLDAHVHYGSRKSEQGLDHHCGAISFWGQARADSDGWPRNLYSGVGLVLVCHFTDFDQTEVASLRRGIFNAASFQHPKRAASEAGVVTKTPGQRGS